MLAAQSVKASRQDGSVRLLGNRYWDECLHDHMGEALTIRFDPDKLYEGVYIYRQDGVYIGFAECIEAAGFFSAEDAKSHGRKVRDFKRKTKELATLEQQISSDELIKMLKAVEVEEPTAPEPAATRLIVGNTARVIEADQDHERLSEEDVDKYFSAGLSIVQGGKEY
jgi:hypothetical protein